MVTIEAILRFDDDTPPLGCSPWVVVPTRRHIDIVPADPAWADDFERVAARLRDALGALALDIFHVGSTSVPGLPAKPVIDVDCIVARPSAEEGWLPPLDAAGFTLTVREPWWQEHRLVRGADPASNVHVFGPDAAEPWRHRIFRDHLRRCDEDREQYAAAKLDAARASNLGNETVMDYNGRKQAVLREIYGRAFAAAGLVEGPEA